MATKKRLPVTRRARAANSGLSFPVVAIGASAGGLPAFTELLQALPARTGMALVLIQHLEPKRESALSSLLSRATRMAVLQAADRLPVEPDHVYVIPPGIDMTIAKGRLQLMPRPEHGTQHPIDNFCFSLATDQGSTAMGVVLSGTGSDGTLGLKAIREAGGVTFAQDPKTAEWPAMPLSAITTGSADFILSPKRIATELVRIARHPYLVEAREIPEGSDLDKICGILRSTVGVDFRLYKPATIRRRIARRMALQKIETLAKYARVLKQDPKEAQALADDIFIHVTRFFRDPECFLALRKDVLKKICQKRTAEDPIRIWVAGCSTGEEVYSIAMLLLEELGERANRVRIQIFGTDIQERAVEHARTGIYSESAVAGISPARLKRFFTPIDHGHQIQKFIRDLCVFARHDLASDPPFSRMDLISCRNVLIYMSPVLQKRILSSFQYALKPEGFLFLGNSESISDYSDAFGTVDQKNRIFVRKPSAGTFRPPYTIAELPLDPGIAPRRPAAAGDALDLRRDAENALLEYYAPPALIVDPDLRIVHFQGDTSPYLSPATGQPSFHLLKMVRPELVVDLRTAIYRARRERIPVHTELLLIHNEQHQDAVRIDVHPLPKHAGQEQDLLVVFSKTDLDSVAAIKSRGGRTAARKRAAASSARIERELASAREHLRTLIAEHEAAQEETRSAHEEVLSSNEELQSTNEELETAKEELQSSNEELITLNEELQHRNDTLNLLTHDLNNLLTGIDIPVLVLDTELRVRQFTPVAGTLLNLIPGDVGRPFSNISPNLNVTDWKEIFAEVTQQKRAVEREVQDRGGHRYSLRVRPYRVNSHVGGVLVLLLDIETVSQARDEAQRAGDYARTIIDTIHAALITVDFEFRVQSVNRNFCEMFHVMLPEIRLQSLFTVRSGQWDVPGLRERLQAVVFQGAQVRNWELDQVFPKIGRRVLLISACRIEGSQTILIAISDFTERKLAGEAVVESQKTIRALLESTTQSIVAVDPSGKIVLANGNVSTMFGYDSRELLGRPLDILVPEGARGRHREYHRKFFQEMRARPMGLGLSLEGQRKDGTTFPVEVGLGVIETAAGTLGVAFISDITQRVELERSVQLHADQVRALAASLLTAQEEERRKVSRDLHDQICQQLASLAIDTGGLAAHLPPPDELPSQLRTLQTRITRASEEVRHIAYGLHPSVLDDLGVVASLRALAGDFSKQTGIPVKFSSTALQSVVPREIASCLYRIAQESLQNVTKHARAKHVTIRIAQEENNVVLSVSDDGSGFDPAAVRGQGGLGLISMEERARMVHGKLLIKAQPGRGTQILATIPWPGVRS